MTAPAEIFGLATRVSRAARAGQTRLAPSPRPDYERGGTKEHAVMATSILDELSCRAIAG